jgi:hypothetical protein
MAMPDKLQAGSGTTPAAVSSLVTSSQVASYVAMDGADVEVTSAVAIGPASSFVSAQLRGLGISYVHLVAGPSDLAESLARSPEIATGMEFDEEYDFQGGRLRLGSGKQPIGPDGARYGEIGPDGHGRPSLVRMGIWYGKALSLHVIRYGGRSKDLLAIFGQFQISERTRGIVCVPKDPTITFFIEGPGVIVDLPGVGVLETVRLTKRNVRSLPPYAGTAVRGGELFIDNMGKPNMFLVLVGDTSRTTVVPYAGAPEERLTVAMSHLMVTWRGPK